MGFNTFVKEVNGKIVGMIDSLFKTDSPRDEEISLQMNGGGDVKIQNQTAKCFLHITVNTRSHRVSFISLFWH